MRTVGFANFVQDLAVDTQVSEHVIATCAPADRCALVIFTPRSGSSWLTKIVAATRKLGFLEEYINPDFVREVALRMHATQQATLLAMLKRQARTDNGVFSMEARALDIELFGEAEFFEGLGENTMIFMLWRDNIVAQGISLYRAVTTGYYHSTSAAAPPPDYDADKITEWMQHIVQIENENLALVERRNLHARFLRYEDIVRDRRTTLAIFADALHVTMEEDEFAASQVGGLHKIGDGWNRNAEQCFRKERHDFVWSLEAQRRIRHEP
jgi:trehalose 2-sulfotransferase